MHELLVYYQAIPTDFWALLLGGTAVSVFAKFLTHAFGLNSRKVVTTLVAALSFALPALQFLISTQAGGFLMLVPHSAEIFAFATLAYNFLVKDLYVFLKQVKAYQNTQLATPAATVATGAAVVTTPATPEQIEASQSANEFAG